jgi:hypothetical protein
MPIREVSFKVDIAMTVLLRCALDDAPAAALVLSHVLGRAEWEGTLATDLATDPSFVFSARPLPARADTGHAVRGVSPRGRLT